MLPNVENATYPPAVNENATMIFTTSDNYNNVQENSSTVYCCEFYKQKMQGNCGIFAGYPATVIPDASFPAVNNSGVAFGTTDSGGITVLSNSSNFQLTIEALLMLSLSVHVNILLIDWFSRFDHLVMINCAKNKGLGY